MRKLYVSLVVLSGLMFGVVQTAAADHEIIGAPKCKTCHKAKTGDQWKIWTDSAHASAFETLASEESRTIASKLGLGDPQQETACLKCHATLASLGGDVPISAKGNYANSEGVGCEACHGPGSDYKSSKTMKDPAAARAAGLVMDGTPDACISCHNEESPTFKGFDFEARWAEIAHPVPVAEEDQATSSASDVDMPDMITFTSSVGNVSFSHGMHAGDLSVECVECHHQIHAKVLDTPHPGYMESSWIKCQTCHNTDPVTSQKYYKCSDCHHSNLDDIADETLSSKVVIHKNCWTCHETSTGVEASSQCADCHIKNNK